jgi:hypothetical protein
MRQPLLDVRELAQRREGGSDEASERTRGTLSAVGDTRQIARVTGSHDGELMAYARIP